MRQISAEERVKELEAALREIQRQPKGHNCPGYCRQMYAIACAALERHP